MVDKSQCIPVSPGGSCPECGWTWNSPEWTEPHPVLPHGAPKAPPLGKCGNCDMPWNLDEVKCSTCNFEPKAPEAYDKLRDQKNEARRTQYLAPLPVRAQPITSTANAAKPRHKNSADI